MSIFDRREFAKRIVAMVTGAAVLPAIGQAQREPAPERVNSYMPSDPRRNYMYPDALRAMLTGGIDFERHDFNIALMSEYHAPGERVYEHIAPHIVRQHVANMSLQYAFTEYRARPAVNVHMKDVTFKAVYEPVEVVRIVLYRSAPAPRLLIASIVPFGLPVLPSGGDLVYKVGEYLYRL